MSNLSHSVKSFSEKVMLSIIDSRAAMARNSFCDTFVSQEGLHII